MNISTGSKFRHYEMGEIVGRGGMGLVYKALDTNLGRDVAIKVLFPNLAAQEEYSQRFLREAQAVARIDHPNVVKIFDVIRDDDTCSIVMEYLEGSSVSALLAENPILPLAEVLKIARQVAAGLSCSHERGVHHRDIKPGNLILNKAGTVKILDFGLARFADMSAITLTGNIMGTIDYMAPEQVLNEPIDRRADLYSLGIVIYEMIAGRRPFSAAEPIAVVYQHINDTPVPPSNYRAGLPKELDQMVGTLLAKQPVERYQTADELLAELDVCRALILEDVSDDDQATVTLEERPVQVGVPTAQPRDEFQTDLVGRSQEQERLREGVRHALTGNRQLTFLAGSEGTGKTRLAVDALKFADEQGMWTLFGSCLYHEISVPYHPFVDALSQRLQTVRTDTIPARFARLRTRILEDTPEVAILMPQIWTAQERRKLEENTPASLNPQAEQQRLFQAIMHLMLTMAEERGVVLCVDDLHWGDSGSVQLLHYLARQLPDWKLHLIATYRPEEIEDREGAGEAPLAETIRRMTREGIGEFIELTNLDETNVRSLVHGIVGSRAVPVSITDRVYKESGGNPLFAIEVLKWWRDKTRGEAEGRDWENLEQILNDHDIAPPRVNDLIERRLSRLQDGEREILELAAVCGNRFDVNDLAKVTGNPHMKILRQLVQLERRHGIIASVERAVYQFTHGNIRDVLERELPEALRQAYHAAWSKVFLDREQAGEEILPEVLANHLFHGGDEEAALPYLKQAAERAKKMSAYREAQKYWEQVDATLSREAPVEVSKDQIEVDLHLGRIYSNQGDYEEATRRFKHAFGTAQKCGDGRAQGDALMALGAILRNQNKWDGALKLFGQALKLYEQNDDRKGIAAVFNYMASIAYWRGQWREAEEHYEKALGIFTEINETAEIASITSNLGGVAYVIGDDETAIQYYRKSAQGHQRTKNSIGMAEVDTNLGLIYERKENWGEALDHHKESVEIFERIGNNKQLWSTYINYARVLARLGDLQLADDICLKSEQMLIEIGNKRGMAEVKRVQGIIATQQEEWALAKEIFDECELMCKESKDLYGHCETIRERAMMYYQKREITTAILILQEAEKEFEKIGAHGDVAVIKQKLSLFQRT